MLLLYRCRQQSLVLSIRIYIPLCFYFILPASSIPPESHQFTFHYASTLSTILILRNRTASSFTFHYASTLSRQAFPCLFPVRIYIPLCFYFILDREGHYCSECLIYIPLCFYFICLSCLRSAHSS